MISDSELSLTSKTQMFGFIEYFTFFYVIVYEQIFIFFIKLCCQKCDIGFICIELGCFHLHFQVP